MNKYVNPTCNSSLATSRAKSVMAISCGEREVNVLFTEDVSGFAEWEFAIAETASTVSLAPNICVVPYMSVTVRGS